jgi:bifunctional DNA-binding transcriptional regulator/antitoxin component of YhaV-PrlF toxin-antitoxin module
MPRKKLSERNIRKLSKSGGKSYSITLPIEAIREFGWQKKQKLEVEIDKKNKKIIIKDWEK